MVEWSRAAKGQAAQRNGAAATRKTNRISEIMNIKRILLITVIIAIAGVLQAQDERPTFEDYLKAKQQGFGKYQQQKESDFNSFRKQANEQYSAKMAEAWQLFDMEPPTEEPKMPGPDHPLYRDDEAVLPSLPVKPSGTLKPILPENKVVEPRPQPKIDSPLNPDDAWFHFNYHHTPCKVRLDNRLKFTLSNIEEPEVAETWRKLSGEASNVLVEDCFRLVNEMHLCDWAAVGVFKALSDAFLGDNTNESILMQMYLLVQSGYKVRIGRKGNSLVLLVPFDEKVYGYSYYKKDGLEYYDITHNKSKSGCYIFDMVFPKEKLVSLHCSTMPDFANDPVVSRPFSTKRYPDMNVAVTLNRNLLEFYGTYPHCRWDNYVYAGLSDCVKQSLYPTLQKAIEGKKVQEAADMLLNFMHFAFDYKTDDDQFGYERPFFADELFSFPYNDCEDRAILYSILVRDLLGIDALLLEYPNHLSTAICLPGDVKGFYLDFHGQRYVLCDPTYIGSHIGDLAEPYRAVQPMIIELK